MKYFFDMDGVMFDWEKAFFKTFGKSAEAMDHEELQAAKEQISHSDFYENLEIIEEGINLFHSVLNMGEEAAILTSVGKFNSEGVAEQKKSALVRVLGYLPEFHYTKSSKEKAAFAGLGVLVDDRLKAVNPFRAAGGTAVLFVQTKPMLAA